MGRNLNCQPVAYIRALPRLTRGRVPGLSVCVLMSSIRISLVVVAYRRRSLSYDIVAMCGWQLINSATGRPHMLCPLYSNEAVEAISSDTVLH